MMKQITQMNITWLKIPAGRRQTSSRFTKRDRGAELEPHSAMRLLTSNEQSRLVDVGRATYVALCIEVLL